MAKVHNFVLKSWIKLKYTLYFKVLDGLKPHGVLYTMSKCDIQNIVFKMLEPILGF